MNQHISVKACFHRERWLGETPLGPSSRPRISHYYHYRHRQRHHSLNPSLTQWLNQSIQSINLINRRPHCHLGSWFNLMLKKRLLFCKGVYQVRYKDWFVLWLLAVEFLLRNVQQNANRFVNLEFENRVPVDVIRHHPRVPAPRVPRVLDDVELDDGVRGGGGGGRAVGGWWGCSTNSMHCISGTQGLKLT